MAKKRFVKRNAQDSQPAQPEFSTDSLSFLDGINKELVKARGEYIKNNVIQCKAPAPDTPDGAAMDSCASAQYQTDFNHVNQHLLAYYVASSSFIGYYACAVIAQHWLVSKGCKMKARDAVKKWYDVSISDGTELDSKQIKLIEKLDKKYKLKHNMVESCGFREVFGVRHILFKHTDPNFDYEQPFNPDSFKDGKYAGISQIDPYWITPVLENNDLTDPTAIGFYEPTYWEISGKKYHKSHFVVLLGDEPADYLKPTYRYGGIPTVQKVYERVYAAERTANEAPQLAMTKRTQVRKTDLAKVQANKSKFVQNLQTANEFKDNYGVTVIGKEEEMNQLDTTLSDLDDVIMSQYQLVCSEFGVPATKMLGTSPKGFSTGETDNDIYIEDVEELQGNDMTDIAMAHYKRLIPSELLKAIGVKDLEIELEWRPIKVMSEKEKAEVNFNKAQTDGILFDRGAIDNIDIRQRLVNDKNSGHSGMSMPEEIEEPDEPEESEEELE